MDHNQFFSVVKFSLWGNGKAEADQEIYEEMRMHRIFALAKPVLEELSLSQDLYKEWEKCIIKQFGFYCKYCYIQETLPISLPYVILKGTSAAQYYPYPELRNMGDIDIITRQEDYQAVCDMLLHDDFIEIHEEAGNPRHRAFIKRGVIIEVHTFFALMNNSLYASAFDNLIFENINPSHVLPDLVNGLVLIEHINQHLEEGLGLRQIIDWMMFVHKCLPDENWPEFNELVQKTGLEKLTITVTKMCEMYLGLSPRKWCAEADDSLCTQLMEYIMTCGDFGKKKKSSEDTSEYVFYLARSPKAVFKFIQERGITNWELAQRHAVLRPFAWIHQVFKYIKKGFFREEASSKLAAEYKAAQKRNEMLNKLGVRRRTKAQAIYQDGKYEMR